MHTQVLPGEAWRTWKSLRWGMRLMAVVAMLAASAAHAADSAATTKPADLVNALLDRIAAIVEPPANAPASTFMAKLRVTRCDGIGRDFTGATAEVMVQAPDRAGVALRWREKSGEPEQAAALCRDGQQLWVHVPGKKFGVIGKPGVARFAGDPQSLDTSSMGHLALPFSMAVIKLPLLITRMELLADEEIEKVRCRVVRLALPEQLGALLDLPPVQIEVAIREIDQLPARIRATDGRANIEVVVENPRFLQDAAAPAQWQMRPNPGDKIETVALSHLLKCMDVIQQAIDRKIPALGPARGQKKLVATSGQGRLENHDGTRVLFLKGTPEDMGKQQGELLRDQARDLVYRILYGVGVGSSFIKGKWFFGEIEEAQRRVSPFISQRIYREIDAMADAAGVHRHEARLANFFPELFHCTGFAIAGEASTGGTLYHGRVLDYLRGVGLEGNAAVIVYQPDEGHAWVNCGYAGFVGTVTAMNIKGISVGEMGGRGEGNWDGKPMAQLIREVMEKASTLDEAIEIMRKGPRTCEYYYVIAEGKTGKAVGIAATPTKFEVLHQGEAHPLLPTAVKDCVLLSSGDRYKKLVERVQAGYGKFNEKSARDLMDRPVCMTSNIQSVLFAPGTLDFWVANADSKNVASHTRYTKYNLKVLLESAPAPKNNGVVDRIKNWIPGAN